VTPDPGTTSREQSIRRLYAAGAVLFLLGAYAAAAWRIQLGVSFTDEAFYVAIPYTFTLGNVPFVNELALQQTAALLATPVTALFVAWRGTDGIVLFFRVLFLILAAVSGAALYRAARIVLPVPPAIILTVLPLVTVPGIFSISYNSLGMNLLAAGAALAAHGVTQRNRISLALAGPALVLAAFSYPTFLVPAGLCVAAMSVIPARAGSRAEWRLLVYSFLVSAVIAFAVMASLGWDNLATSLLYMLRHARHGGSAEKVAALWQELSTSAPYSAWQFATLAATTVLTLLFRRGLWLGTTVVLILLAGFHGPVAWQTPAFVTIYAVLFLTPLAVAVAWRSGAPAALLLILAVGIVASMVSAWTSSNGLPNAVLGTHTALFSCLLLCIHGDTGHRQVALTAATAILLGSIGAASFRFVYTDAPLPELTARVESGPFAGLHTTEVRRDFVTQLAADVTRFGSGKRVVFHDSFPAGYLFVDTAPPIQTTWIPYAIAFPAFDRSWYTTYYTAPGNRPDVAFEILALPRGPGRLSHSKSTPADPMRFFFGSSGTHVLASENQYYAVYTRCETCTTTVVEAESLSAEAAVWRSVSDGFGGEALATNSAGATLSGTVPRFRPGAYRVDLAHLRREWRTHALLVTMGGTQRRVDVAPTAPFRTSRIGGLVFPDVRRPDFSIEVVDGGRRALVLDQIVFTHATRSAELAGTCDACMVGPVVRSSVGLELETLVRASHTEERRKIATEWVRVEGPRWSGNGAIATSGRGVTLDTRVEDLAADAYRTSLYVHHPAPGFEASVRVTLGGVTREMHTDPSLPRGVHLLTAVFPGVRGNSLTLTCLDPGSPNLIIDRVTFDEMPRGE
jgi:hypothetical protein